MQCMKCGVDVPDGQVFCDNCLEIMSRYPVKPGTPVQILPRTPRDRSAKKRDLSPEEQLSRQKILNRRLRLLIWLLCIALAGAIGILIYGLLLPSSPGGAGLL